MIEHLPTELRHQILSYIIPPACGQAIKLYLTELPYGIRATKFRYGKHNPNGELFAHVFRISRQLQQDAVDLYYGSRPFYLEHGLRYQRESAAYHTNKAIGDALRTDSLSLLPAYALRAIRHLHVLVRDDLADSATQRRIRAVLASFVGKLLSGQHSLRSLEVHVVNAERFWSESVKLPNASCFRHRFEVPLAWAEAMRYGYLLEPLAQLHGVEMVMIKGTNPEIDRKLERLMRSPSKVPLRLLQCAASPKRTSGKPTGITKSPQRPRRKSFEPTLDWSWV